MSGLGTLGSVAAGGVGTGILLYSVRLWFVTDRMRQRQADVARKRVEELERENGELHDEINRLKSLASRADAHAEGLKVEIEWREAQSARLEAEIERQRLKITRLEEQLASRGGGTT